ncbi:uncharacterized protein [Lolium perenne]|uniref:uncharacterized protein n=1 Tax=Lolium perenne TaxID=4522 RepID=UPI0021F5D5F6|nr:uncharacterized protein LOC127329416 [Lolium perenne]
MRPADPATGRPGDRDGGAPAAGFGRHGLAAAIQPGAIDGFAGFEAEAGLNRADTGDGGGGAHGRWTSAIYSDDPISFSWLEDLGCNVDWTNLDAESTQVVAHMEEDAQDEGFVDEETDSDNYDDFLVRCEGDTDVEDCFPTRLTAENNVFDEERRRVEMANLQKEGTRKTAKDKAELSRAAKRRAIEGVLEEQCMEFSDVASDDCRELTDSSDDDGAVDEEKVFVTKRKSKSKKQSKRKYYDESKVNAHELLEVKLCFGGEAATARDGKCIL